MTYTKISFSMLFALVIAYAVVISPVFALSTTDSGSTAGNAPATSNGASTASIGTTDAGSTAGGNSGPSTSNGGSTAAPGTTDAGSTAGSSVSSGGSANGGGLFQSSSSSHMGGSIVGSTASIVTPIISVTDANCSFLTSYLNISGKNNAAEVAKLQTFLKNVEKINVDINGTFDQKTFDAVKTFQAKYVDEVMAPWGVKTPTGNVSYTTKKKINEIVCKTSFALTPAEVSKIASYKNSLKNAPASLQVMTSTTTTIINIDSTEVGTNSSTTDTQTASVVTTPSTNRIKSFIKWLFGY